MATLTKPFRLTPPKEFVPTEFDDQCAIFDYARIKERQDPRWKLLFSTLNGVRLPIGLARKVKRAGNKAGVPDLILPVSIDFKGGGCYYGLMIELKREKGGHISDDQKWWHEALTEQGYRVAVCKGARDAIKTIEDYLA